MNAVEAVDKIVAFLAGHNVVVSMNAVANAKQTAVEYEKVDKNAVEAAIKGLTDVVGGTQFHKGFQDKVRENINGPTGEKKPAEVMPSVAKPTSDDPQGVGTSAVGGVGTGPVAPASTNSGNVGNTGRGFFR